MIYPIEQLVIAARVCWRLLPSGRWVPSRALGRMCWQMRLRAAWGVWTGRYDAVDWGQQ